MAEKHHARPGVMSIAPAAAVTLAGRLNFAVQPSFGRFGRTFVRPVYARQYGRGSAVSTALRLPLKIWASALALRPKWSPPRTSKEPVLHVYTDAARGSVSKSFPPRIAGIILWEGTPTVVARDVSDHMADRLRKRRHSTMALRPLSS
jgi:hypothetical protein